MQVATAAALIARRVILALLVAAITAPFLARGAGDAPQPRAPQLRQPGKDVIWLPTADPMVDAMLDAAKVAAGDFVIDLGSGDGRIVIAAARRGAQALGIEFDPDLVALAGRAAAAAGLGDRARFVKADLFESDLSRATVITMFLNVDLNLKLRPKLLALKPGTRVVSNFFPLGGWIPEKTTTVTGNCQTFCAARMWVVPARVAGTWQMGNGSLRLEQRFQVITGILLADGATTPVKGRLLGDRITFAAGAAEYTGRVTATAIVDGSVSGGGKSGVWTASRH